MSRAGSAGLPVRSHAILAATDVAVAAASARRVATAVGLPLRRAAEVAIVTSELASNVLRHGHGGAVDLVVDETAGGRALLLVARDAGPPFRDLQAAMVDGCDDTGPLDPAVLVRRGGLASGLGAIQRLSDGFEISQLEGGKVVLARFDLPIAIGA